MPSLEQSLDENSKKQQLSRPQDRPNDTACNEGQPRTIDYFLEELYSVYKQSLVRNEVYTNGYTSSSLQSPNFLLRIRQQLYRFFFINTCQCDETSSCSCHRYLPLPLLALCIANSSDATEILMLSFLLADPTFRYDMFGRPEGSGSDMEGAKYLASSIFLGMLLGGIVLGFLSDTIGRRPALLIGLLTNATAGTLSSIPFLTPSFKELTLFRFIAGIGIGSTVPPLFSLASEWSPKEIRGSIVTTVASFWMIGSLFVSGVAWGLFTDTDTPGSNATWRIFAALCALPSALGAFMVYHYVPESPRFLTANHNYSLAARSCNQMSFLLKVPANSGSHTILCTIDPPDEDQVEMSSLRLISDSELEASYLLNANGIHSLDHTNESKSVHSIKLFFDTLSKLYLPRLLTTATLPLQFLWFSLSFGTYGITTWINSLFVAVHLQNLYFNSFLFALGNLPGNIICVFYADAWGRRRMLIGSLMGASLSLVGFATVVYFVGQDDTSWLKTNAIILLACAFQMFSIVSWNTIDIISGELFPTCVRSAGMGVCTSSGRMGAMVAQVVNAKLMFSSGDQSEDDGASESVASAWVLVVAASTLLFGALVPFFLGRDTAGGELRDEVDDVDQQKKCTRIVDCGGMLWKTNKDHLSDDEEVDSNRASIRTKNIASHCVEYDSFQHEVEVNQLFLL